MSCIVSTSIEGLSKLYSWSIQEESSVYKMSDIENK